MGFLPLISMSFDLLANLVKTIFPLYCVICKREGEALCQDCFSLQEIPDKFWCLCNQPKMFPEPRKCKQCSFYQLDGLIAPLSFEEKLVKTIIHKFKYPPFLKELSLPLALYIIAQLKLSEYQEVLLAQKPVLVPLPLSKSRLRWRGFNQSELLAQELSNHLGLPMEKDVLIKIKNSIPQMELSKQERVKNLAGAFAVQNLPKIQEKFVLLVDDVYTTGTTMREASLVLKKAGAKKVIGMCVARS